jgi:phosphate transport system permease protein
MSRDLIGKGAIVLLALPALLLPALVLGYIAHKGVAAVSWQFLFDTSQGIGAQLSGSLLLALGACLLAAPLALGTALYHRLLASPRQRRLLDLLLQMLQGIPPIVFGLCGLVVFVHLLQWGVSLASGAVVLAMVILPMLVLNTIAALARIPAEYGEAAQSLGLGHGAVIGRVWLRLAWRPLLTGLLLGAARALSETAPDRKSVV